jgi:muramoyltetrapeptide carboxypeptidase
MLTPAFLQPGDTIAIAAPARKISPEEINTAIEVFEAWGLKVLLSPNLFAISNQYAGTDEQRIADLQMLLDNESVRAIISARGGYGTVRAIDKLDFTKFLLSPKWVIGFSDITVLHSHIHMHFGIETIHSLMPINFNLSSADSKKSIEELRKCLFGENLIYSVQAHLLNRNGVGRGTLIGGNLSILYGLQGSQSDLDTAGKVLFIEDIDEYLYHVDRMMVSLKRSGKLHNLAGLIVGGFTGMRDNETPFGKTAEEIISEAVIDYKFPVVFGFPAGHQPLNLPLIFGREVTIEVSDETCLITNAPVQKKGFKWFKTVLKPIIFFISAFILLYLFYALVLKRL